MATDVLQEFLVKLGFKIDGAKEFERKVDDTTTVVDKLGIAAYAASVAVSAAFLKISDNLEQLYFASQRTGAAVSNIQAFGFAVGQMGGSAAGARESLESLARFMRNSPGGEGLIGSIGVQTRQANGGLRDTEQILEDLGKQFRGMPYYRANAYAGLLGIDEKTLQAMIKGVGEYGQRYRDLLAAVGLNSQDAARTSHDFWVGLRDVQAVMEAIAMKAVYRLEQALQDVSDWFHGLSDDGQLLVKVIAGIAAGWIFLNSVFVTSPVGRVIMLGAALLALYDDYKTWKEGGQSLIDWAKWEPGIKLANEGIDHIGKYVRWLGDMASWATSKLDLMISAYSRMVGLGKTTKEAAGNVANTLLDAAGFGPIFNQGGEAGAKAGATGPRNERNNNSGNLKFAGQPGATRGADGFAVFASPAAGLAAMSRQLSLYGSRGLDTISGIINTYSPANSEGNSAASTANYIGKVSSALGLSPDAHMQMSDPALRARLMTAMIGVEGGRNPYSAQQINAGAGVTVNQTNNITVSGSGDSHAIGAQVASAVNDSNARLVREMRPAVIQ